jgi:hypothetical protein
VTAAAPHAPGPLRAGRETGFGMTWRDGGEALWIVLGQRFARRRS